MNQNKLTKYFQVAQAFAEFSPDQETKVGSILINKKSGAVLSSGYNGFVRGADDDKLPTTRPDKYDYIVHSETNLIYNAARHGVTTSDCFVVCTLSPCCNCLRAMYQAGIDEIYYRDTYRDFHKNLQMGDLIILLTNMGDYTKITLRSKKQ